MSFDRQSTPKWRQGYRFQYEPAQKGDVLLYPEGMIKLNIGHSIIARAVMVGLQTAVREMKDLMGS